MDLFDAYVYVGTIKVASTTYSYSDAGYTPTKPYRRSTAG